MSESVIFSNTRGFQVKQAQVDHFVQNHRPAVFLIAEHFQSTSYYLRITGYTLAGCFCRNSREQGGVAIFVRDDIDYEPRGDLDALCVYKQFEARSVEIPSRNLVVTVVYRPNAGSIDLFYSVLDKFLKIYNQNPHTKYLMAGTFNLAKRDDMYVTETILKQHNFKFSVSSVTHVNGTSVDDFIVNFTPTSKTVMGDRFSDHNCIRLGVPVKVEDKDSRNVSVKDSALSERILPKIDKLPHQRIDFLLRDLSRFTSNLRIQKLQPLELAVHSLPTSVHQSEKPSPQNVLGPIVKKELVLDQAKATNISLRALTDNPPVPISNSSAQIKPDVKPSTKEEKPPPEPISKTPSKDNPLDIEAVISRCLTSDEFMDKFVSKLSEKFTNKLAESLSESLNEAKDQIHRLENKVSSLEVHIMKLEDELTL